MIKYLPCTPSTYRYVTGVQNNSIPANIKTTVIHNIIMAFNQNLLELFFSFLSNITDSVIKEINAGYIIGKLISNQPKSFPINEDT